MYLNQSRLASEAEQPQDPTLTAAKPKAPTAPVAATPTGPAALPLAPTPAAPGSDPLTPPKGSPAPSPAPAAPTGAAPIQPAPLATNDPLAFAPPTTSDFSQAMQTATSAQDAANAAAHSSTSGAPQTTDPYGLEAASAPGGTRSATFDPQLAAAQQLGIDVNDPSQMALYQLYAQYHDTGDAAWGLALNGVPQTADQQRQLLASNMDRAKQFFDLTQQLQGGESAAMANGFVDPAIRSQFFNADNTPKNYVPPDTMGAANTAGYNGPPMGASGNLVPASGPARLAPSSAPSSPPASGPSAPSAPQGRATDTNPSTLLQEALLGNGAGGAGASGTSNGTTGGSQVGAGVSLTPTTVDNALTNSTIAPNNTVDRVKLAQDALQNTIQNVLDPAEAAQERDASRYAFGAGRGVSGIARTAQGNIQTDYNRQKTNLSNTLLNSAVNGSIEDLYRNIGIAQQQQGFQAGQQNTAFQQALQQLELGSQGDPSNIDLILAQIFGSGSNAASSAASNYVASQQAQQSQALQQQQMDQLIQSLINNGYNNTTSAILGQGLPPVYTTPSG